MTTAPPAPASTGPTGTLDRFFEISKRGSTIGTEIRGGLVTFVTMAYIVILNPIILAGKPDVAGDMLDFNAVGAATALTAGIMTILFGVVTRLPFGFAAGLGINAFVAFSVVGQVTWPEAMALVMVNGVVIVLLAATGLRKAIFDAVPFQLKIAITVGIGLFIAFIGFVNSGFVTATGASSPPVGLGVNGSVATVPSLLFVITLLLTGILVALRIKGGMLIGLIGGTVLAVVVEAIWHIGARGVDDEGNVVNPGGWGLTVPALNGSPVSVPDLSLIGAVDFSFDLGKVSLVALVMIVFTLLFTNFFDAMGTMTGLAKEANLADDNGDFPRIKSALVVEGVGAIAGGATSSSSSTVFIESGAGIGEGARTGLANVVTGIVFLIAMFLTPLTSIVPTEIAAAALIIVGAMMMAQIRHIDFGDFRVLLPVFLTVSVMPLTYS
ncbi:MFS transporter, partial [Microbacterium sp. UMB0228]|uniref:NCS2 family permease n=2 Tax=unclassified Microbacterium TaxID=2609290 RepID=UPI000C80DC6C